MKYLFLFFFLSIPLRAIIIPFDFSGPSANNVDTNPATSVFLTVTSTGIIEDLNLVMEIQAGHTEDFDIFLTSPLGTKSFLPYGFF